MERDWVSSCAPSLTRLELFELDDVWKSFGSESVLRGIDLRMVRGECLGLIGPSGAGKSVLLKCMIGLLPIDHGRLLFDGKSVPRMNAQEQLQLRRRVGFLFQGSVLFDSMTVAENLEYALHEQFFRTMRRAEMRERVSLLRREIRAGRSTSLSLSWFTRSSISFSAWVTDSASQGRCARKHMA